MKIVTVRLGEKHLKILEQLSEALDLTKSDVIRYSLEVLDLILKNVGDEPEKAEALEKFLSILKNSRGKALKPVVEG